MDIATFGNLYCNGDAAPKQHESALICVFLIAGVGLESRRGRTLEIHLRACGRDRGAAGGTRLCGGSAGGDSREHGLDQRHHA